MKQGIKKWLKITGVFLLFTTVLAAGFILGKIANKDENAVRAVYVQQLVQDFMEISDIVRENYSLLESKQINIDSLFQVYVPYVKEVESFDEYRMLLMRYFAELRNGHTGLTCWWRFDADGAVILVESRVFIERAGRSLARLGVNVKDEIIEIDGISALEWINKQQRYVSASTDKSRFHRASWRIFSSLFPVTRTLLLNTQSGKREITLELSCNSYRHRQLVRQRRNVIEARTINDYIGYIEILSMQGSVVDEFRRQFERFRTKPILIVDVRRNGGGNSIFSEDMVEYLIRKEQIASVWERRLKPQENHFEGKLIVLTGVSTFSAAESFVLDLKESGNAILIGSETGGCTGLGPQSFTTSLGTSFRFPTRAFHLSPQGFPMEGVGIPPHIFVYQTVEDYLNGIDTVLEFAINFASSQ